MRLFVLSLTFFVCLAPFSAGQPAGAQANGEKVAPGPASLIPFDPAAKQDDPVNIGIGSVNISAFPEIEVYASVWGRDQETLEGLGAGNFALTEQGPGDPSPVTENFSVTVSQGASGIVVCLVMDRSGSMRGQAIADAKEAAKEFVSNFSTADRAALVSFSYSSSVRVDQEFVYTDDAGKALLQDAIDRLGASGSTALYDATIRGVELSAAELGGKNVIAFTDGRENDSHNSINDVINTALASGVAVYTIGIGDSVAENELHTIANQTGGVYYPAPSAAQLLELYNEIERRISMQYLITYRSHNSVQDGTEREVEVTVNAGVDSASDTATYTANLAPQIQRTQETIQMGAVSQPEGEDVVISANIFDYDPITEARLFYRVAFLKNAYTQVAMNNVQDNLWSGIISGDHVASPGLEYYLTASDGVLSSSSPPLNPQEYPYYIAVMPNEAPVIQHMPVTYAIGGNDVLISSTVTDTTQYVATVTLFYRSSETPTYESVEMVNVEGDTYEGLITAEVLTGAGCDYYILATDNLGISSYHGTASAPHRINYGASEVNVGAAWSEHTNILVVRAWAWDAMQGAPVTHGDAVFNIYDRNLGLAASGSMMYDAGEWEWTSGAIPSFQPGEYVAEVNINGMIGAQSFTAGPLYVDFAGQVRDADTGLTVPFADVELYRTLSGDLVVSTTCGFDGSFTFPWSSAVPAGWYYLRASADMKTLKAGRTPNFFTAESDVYKEILISEVPGAEVFTNFLSYKNTMLDVAHSNDELLSHMSESVDHYLKSDPELGELALDFVGLASGAFLLGHGIAQLADLAVNAGAFTAATAAAGTNVLITEGSVLWSVFDLTTSDTLDFPGLFTGWEYDRWFRPVRDNDPEWGFAFECSDWWPWSHPTGDHYLSVQQLHQDNPTAEFQVALDLRGPEFRDFLVDNSLDPDFSVYKALEYLSVRASEIDAWVSRDSYKSEALFYLPEKNVAVALGIRPTYLRYQKNVGIAQALGWSKIVNTGIKVAGAIAIGASTVTGVGPIILGAAVTVGTTAADIAIDQADAQNKWDMAKNWAFGGAFRLRDLILLDRDCYGGALEFLIEETGNPYYLSRNRTFGASIGDIHTEFPSSFLTSLGLPDKGLIKVSTTVTNRGDDSPLTVAAENYVTEGPNLLAFLAGGPLAYLLSNDELATLTDAQVHFGEDDLGEEDVVSQGDSRSHEFALLTGRGWLDYIVHALGTQKVVVKAYAGPWMFHRESSPKAAVPSEPVLTGLRVVPYNLIVEESKRVSAAKAAVPSNVMRTSQKRLSLKDAADYAQRVLVNRVLALDPSNTRATLDVDASDDAHRLVIEVFHSPQADFSLVVTDSNGSRLGFDPATSTRYAEFPGTFSGPQAQPEQIGIPNCSSKLYQVTLILAQSALGEEETASLIVLEEPVRPAVMVCNPEEMEHYLIPEDTVTITTNVAEVGGQIPLDNVQVSISALENANGDVLPLNEAETPASVTNERLMGGTAMGVSFTYALDEDVAAGKYTGEVAISSNNAGQLTQSVRVYLDRTEPDTVLVESPDRPVPEDAIRFEWTGADDATEPELLQFSWILEGVDEEWHAFETTQSADYGTLPEGTYTFKVKAKDRADQEDPSPATATFELAPRAGFGCQGCQGTKDARFNGQPLEAASGDLVAMVLVGLVLAASAQRMGRNRR